MLVLLSLLYQPGVSAPFPLVTTFKAAQWIFQLGGVYTASGNGTGIDGRT